jgi:DNA-directed RNA polymerase subunit RPC12/RpoP
MTQSFSCAACGAPNSPEANKIYMPCTYCGTNLTIPENLRTKTLPKVEKKISKAKPVSIPENEASKLLRKAQPAAIQAWNLYALWSQIRWLIPACFTIFIVGFFLCVALGALPFILRLFR